MFLLAESMWVALSSKSGSPDFHESLAELQSKRLHAFKTNHPVLKDSARSTHLLFPHGARVLEIMPQNARHYQTKVTIWFGIAV
jgi:hypothetical protein